MVASEKNPARNFDWEELLLFLVEDRRVIPVVGKELLVVSIDGQDVTLERYLAGRLARALRVPEDTLPENFDLNDVALVYLEKGGRRRKIYSKLKVLIEDPPLPVPEPLKKLAAIRHFNLYLSTSFDPFLRQAIDLVRFGGEPRTRCLAFSPHSQAGDLPCEVEDLQQPYVYQIFGQLSSSADYVVTEEDALEFVHELQNESNRPPILFDELKDHHLLFLGCGFPNWLARFFIRTVRGERLFVPRQTSEFIVDSQTTDSRFFHFLRHCASEVFVPGDALGFVEALHERWCEENPDAATSEPAEPEPASAGAPAAAGMERGAIFLSYASQDRPVAEAMRAALDAAGLDVWFDRKELRPGDSWNREIQKNIRRCSLFIPFISANTRRRLEGYFRREWRWAIDRAQGFDESVPFIQPVIIDDTPPEVEGIPSYFWTRQCARFPDGRPTPAFVERARDTIRRLRAREGAW